MEVASEEFDLCPELGKQHVNNKAELRKKAVFKKFPLTDILSDEKIRATVALRLGNIEIERYADLLKFENL